MKSDVEQLRNRGFITAEDLSEYANCDKDKLLEMMNDKKAHRRTAAFKLISKYYSEKDELVRLLCEKLMIENKLYTKIAICESLADNGKSSVKIMLDYIGKIGKNQHEEISEKKFNKKSYPLPRDIIARTLCRMGREIMPELIEVIMGTDSVKIREVIDVVGHICFYERNDDVLNEIIECYNVNIAEDIIRWKITRALSSFKSEKSKEKLTVILENEKNVNIIKEAERSLEMLNKKTD